MSIKSEVEKKPIHSIRIECNFDQDFKLYVLHLIVMSAMHLILQYMEAFKTLFYKT